MDMLLYLSLYGILQGCTEVLPVSSAGHVAIMRQIFHFHEFNWELLPALQIAPLLAVALYFHQDLGLLIAGFRSSLPAARSWMHGGPNPFVLTGEQNIPYFMALNFGSVILETWLLEDISDQVFERADWVSFFLLINAILLRIATLGPRGERTIKELELRDFLFIILIQGLAMIPGVSRLGILICAGLLLRMNLQQAFKLAFLLLIPVIAANFLLHSDELLFLLKRDPQLINALILAMCATAMFSFIGLHFLTSRVMDRQKLAFFSSYCLIIGLTAFIYLQF